LVNVSGPNQVPVPSEHPNNDLLADLAAEVLPDDLAGHVQEHVHGCATCSALLADAEGVRQMLLQVEPEEMPDDILARIEQALATARREDEATMTGEGGGETRLLNRVPPLGAETGRPDPGRRIGRSGPATGRVPVAGPMTGSITTGPKTSRLNRMAAPAQSARRQAIEEQKADRPSRIAPLLPALRIAAAVLVVVGVGAATVQFTGVLDGSDSADTTAASGSAPTLLVAPVQSTDTKYTRRAMPEQVQSLLGNSRKLLSEGGAEAEQAQPRAATDDAGASAKAASPSNQVTPDASAANQLLRSPEALKACLTALGVEDAQPEAVDLAKYGGREAAIIVVPATGAGYDVWVVARTCAPGSDGTIAVIRNVNP
jgi:hypothetical protein